MVITALKMGRDQTTTADLKLFNRSLKELRYAARVFAPYRHVHKVVVFGSARTKDTEPEAQAAEEFARRMREELGYMTIIRAAATASWARAQRGAGREEQFRAEHPAAVRAAGQRDDSWRPEADQLQLLLHPEAQLRQETPAVALFPGGFGTMDGLRGAHPHADRQGAASPVVLVDRPGGAVLENVAALSRE